jgi:hypothetical protein
MFGTSKIWQPWQKVKGYKNVEDARKRGQRLATGKRDEKNREKSLFFCCRRLLIEICCEEEKKK